MKNSIGAVVFLVFFILLSPIPDMPTQEPEMYSTGRVVDEDMDIIIDGPTFPDRPYYPVVSFEEC